ncbi:MAG: hypothetical protein ACFFCO_08095 [Promethearchaeota archaeon]
MKLSWKMIGALCGILGPLLFVIITVVAMIVRPVPYIFWENSFSSLGLMVTETIPSMLNYYLFVAACTSAAVCTVPFWFAIRTLFTETSFVRITSWLGTILGLIAVPCLSGLSIISGDFGTPHTLFTISFFLLISTAIVIYSAAIAVDNDYHWSYAIPGLIIGIICYAYALGLFVPGLEFIGSAAVQKVAVYGLVIWSAFQAIKLIQEFK